VDNDKYDYTHVISCNFTASGNQTVQSPFGTESEVSIEYIESTANDASVCVAVDIPYATVPVGVAQAHVLHGIARKTINDNYERCVQGVFIVANCGTAGTINIAMRFRRRHDVVIPQVAKEFPANGFTSGS
jgi:hypothetical protein